MIRWSATIGAVFLFITGVGCAGNAAYAQATAPPFDLSSTFQRLISAAASPSGFAVLGRRGARIDHFFLAPRFPQGYVIYQVSGTREYVVADGPRNIMAVIWVDESAVIWIDEAMERLATKLGRPVIRAAETEKILAPFLGDHYSRHVLQTGMLFTSRGRPTVEFAFIEGLPTEVPNVISFDMAVIVFPPHAAVLELISPCDRWWLSTPPPGWVRRVGDGCEPHWAQVASPP